MPPKETGGGLEREKGQATAEEGVVEGGGLRARVLNGSAVDGEDVLAGHGDGGVGSLASIPMLDLAYLEVPRRGKCGVPGTSMGRE